MNLQQAAGRCMRYFDRYDIPAEYLMSKDHFDLIVNDKISVCIDDESKRFGRTLRIIREDYELNI